MEEQLIAFQGEPGAYSEQAIREHFGVTTKSLPCRSFEEIFAAVREGRATHGMLPVENSLAGTVIPAYDLLVDHDLRVQAEVIARVEHCLMAGKETAVSDIHRAKSHHQALAQCAGNLKRMGITPVEHYDTAGAARDLANNPEAGTAAVASALAAEIYDLQILVRNFEDQSFNFTRFFVLGREDVPRSGTPKTSIIFTTRHTAGALYGVMGELAKRDINLTKIESRPRGNRAWHYLFYVDFEGHEEDEAVQEALLGILKRSSFLKVLGSYPAAKIVG